MSAETVKPNPLKVELRLDVDARLAAMTDADRARQSNIILSKILAHPKYKSAKRIALFLSLPNEVPTEPILNDILSRGAAPFVPQYSRGQMRMLRVVPGDMELMVETSWKIKQHAKNADREDAMDNVEDHLTNFTYERLKAIRPAMPERFRLLNEHACAAAKALNTMGGLDVVIAPGAAFTRDGWRCGHGGGYYDRLLACLLARHEADPAHFSKPYILAVGFNQQIYPEIPVDIQDVRVNEVLTAE